MIKRWIPAASMLVWLMMMPPPKMPPVKGANGAYEVNMTIPMNNWIVYQTYRNEAACRGDLKSMASYFACVNGDDPAFRKAATTAKVMQQRAADAFAAKPGSATTSQH